jgi:hypothetical protein
MKQFFRCVFFQQRELKLAGEMRIIFWIFYKGLKSEEQLSHHISQTFKKALRSISCLKTEL